MQDAYAPKSSVIQESDIKIDNQYDRAKIVKFAGIIVFFVILILLIFIYRARITSNTEEAQAAILEQAREINDLNLFSNYKNQGGGLYNNSSNSPDLTHRTLIQNKIQNIKPLNEDGFSDSKGKIGWVFIGDPYTKGEFKVFADLISEKKEANNTLQLVDGSEDKFETSFWVKSLYAWESLTQKVNAQELNSKQIQILWVNLGFSNYSGVLDNDIINYQNDLEKIIRRAIVQFPNTQIVYLSSPRTTTNSTITDYSEPSSYETAFGVRSIINKQEIGELVLNNSVSLKSGDPVVLWGPYVWTKGFDDEKEFSYNSENFESDGISLTRTGKQRYAVDLYDFFSTYEYSKAWFLTK